MFTKTHISLDLETWGNRPGSDIRSIGACVLHPHNGWIYPSFPKPGEVGVSQVFYMACDNPMVYISGDPENKDSYGLKYDLKRDPKTIQWWAEQSPLARAAFDNPIDLADALGYFTHWLQSLGVDPKQDTTRIWSHGAGYDIPILSEAYLTLGLPVPWHYRAGRDTRTNFDDAGIENHFDWMRLHQLGTFHHALDDARSQAWAICDAHEKIRNERVIRP